MHVTHTKSTSVFLAAGLLLLAPAVRGQSSVSITPSNPSLLVGQSVQLTLTGAIAPTAIATGGFFTCMRLSDQTARCVGRNNQGQLGDGTFNAASSPVVVRGLTAAVSIRAGQEHACSLIADGTMQCWGTNYTGQLGDGTMGTFSLVPEPVHDISGAIAAVTGGFHTCAILSDHTVKCWGRNQDGQIGNGDSTTDVSLPVSVVGLGPVADLAAGGYHTCARMSDSTVRCWGRNTRGQIGNGSSASPVATPVQVTGLTSVVSLAPGGYHTCALLQDGSVQCWGDNEFGQIGSPAVAYSSVPVTVSGISNVVAIATGFRHSCAVEADGSVWCWGHNDMGQLGDGTTTDARSPVRVAGIAGPSALALGEEHSCALLRDASVRCWGENDFGELGNGTTTNSVAPVAVIGTGVTWSSSDAGVATVDASGRATAVGRGTATITATDPSGNTAGTTITVKELVTLAALRQGDGSGTLISSPAGIDCGSTCAASFVNDTVVTLSATPGTASLFAGWTGCDSVSGTTCTVTMNAARSVTAVFMLQRFTLTVAKTGIGKGTVTSSPAGISCGTACSSDYVTGTAVTLTATPSLGSVFTGWTGCDAVNGASCTVTMSGRRSVSASFLGVPLL